MNSAKRKYGRTFPLHLPPIDWYFLCDDSPQHPMVFYLDLDFRGELDHALMSAALEEALERHPLLYSVVQPAKQNKPCWVPVAEQMAQIDWADHDTPIQFDDGEYIDIRKDTGLRIWAREGNGQTRMTMQLHHATSDGTGAYRFIGDLLACYMSRLPSCAGQVELGDFDVAQLKVRRSKMRSINVGDSTLKKTRLAISEAWKQFGRRVTPLQSPTEQPTRVELPGIVKQEFSGQQLAKLRQFATSQGATMNDLLVAKMFQATRAWNGKMSRGKKLRILVPSDMRDGEDFEIPACNMTAYTFITHTAAEVDDADGLLDRIRQDMLEIKNGSLQKSFINGLTSAMSVPFLLPMILKRNVCLSTCVLSNAGDPSRRFTCRVPKKRGKITCDEFTLEGISGVPPLRRMTHSTVSSSIYGRKLTFSMRCTPELFSLEQSAKFLSLFCDQFQHHMQ